jgi:polyhydroxyalkanoate synthase
MALSTGFHSAGALGTRLQRHVQRSVWRARNGAKYLAGVDRPTVGGSAKDVVWRRDKAQLWRYRAGRAGGPPVVIVMSLVSRSYVLDLRPRHSFVAGLGRAGCDVYLLDWGVADERESANGLSAYADGYVPDALRAAAACAGRPVTVLGYCLGGLLAVFALALRPDLPVEGLITMASPVDFAPMESARIFRDRWADPADLLDATGNVPPDVLVSGFRLQRPTADLAAYATLWERLWDDEFLDGYQALGQWTRDHVPFPGAAFTELAAIARDNAVVSGSVRLAGRPVDPGAITSPVLVLTARTDHVVPPQAATPLLDLVRSQHREHLQVDAGHVALVAGRQAATQTIPAIARFAGNSDAVGAVKPSASGDVRRRTS